MRIKSILLAGVLFAAGFAVPAHAEPQTVLVFFSEWSASIDSDAVQAVQSAAADLAKEGAGHKVTVTGYADTTGSEKANKLLSELRAQVVTDKLVEDGVPADSIELKAEGETPAPSDSKQESRRVSITID